MSIRINKTPTKNKFYGATLLVASSTADNTTKLAADYVCDGVGDEVEINAALASILNTPEGGKVKLSKGKFITANSINMFQQNAIDDNGKVILEGTGTTIIDNSDGTGNAIEIGGAWHGEIANLTVILNPNGDGISDIGNFHCTDKSKIFSSRSCVIENIRFLAKIPHALTKYAINMSPFRSIIRNIKCEQLTNNPAYSVPANAIKFFARNQLNIGGAVPGGGNTMGDSTVDLCHLSVEGGNAITIEATNVAGDNSSINQVSFKDLVLYQVQNSAGGKGTAIKIGTATGNTVGNFEFDNINFEQFNKGMSITNASGVQLSTDYTYVKTDGANKGVYFECNTGATNNHWKNANSVSIYSENLNVIKDSNTDLDRPNVYSNLTIDLGDYVQAQINDQVTGTEPAGVVVERTRWIRKSIGAGFFGAAHPAFTALIPAKILPSTAGATKITMRSENKTANTLATYSWTKLTNWVEISDSANAFNNAAGNYVASKAMTVVATAGHVTNMNSIGTRGLSFWVNSVNKRGKTEAASITGPQYMEYTTTLDLQLGDIVDCRSFTDQNGTTELIIDPNTAGPEYRNYFQVTEL